MFSMSALNRFAVLCTGFAVALLIPAGVGAGSISASRVAAVVVISVLSLCLGQALATVLRLPYEPGLISAFKIVAGYAALSIIHLAATSLLNLNAGGALLADAVVGGIVSLAIRIRDCRPGRLDSILPPHVVCTLRSIVIDASVLILISALVTVWAREALVSVREAHTTGIFRVWSDFLIFSIEIKHLENYPAFARQSLYLADVPQIFYHRASFSLSAAYSWITKDPSLETATYFWMPSGIILMGISVYGLGCALAGRAAGIASVTALFLLPDASMYWLSNGYFAFHWLIQVAPGSGYAIALGLVALAVYSLGIRYANYRYVFVGVVLVLASALFRTHIAIPMIILFVILSLVAWRPVRPIHRTIVIALLLVLTILTVLAFERVALAPHFLTGHRDWLRYIEAVHAATPIAYEGLYAKWTVGTRTLWKAIVGYMLMLPAEYGAILPVMVLVLFLKRRFSSFIWQVSLIPFFILAVHTAIIFLMPTPRHGDITDWSHRSFVLVYAVLLIFTVSWIISLCKERIPDTVAVRVIGFSAGLLVVSAGMVVPWHYGKNVQYGSLRDGPTACATAISADMFKATRFIREHSNFGEKILSSDNDPLALTIALTGLQSYVSLKKYFQTFGGDLGKLATERSAANDRLSNCTTFEELAAFCKYNNIQWYLLRHKDMPAWPPQLLKHAVFTSGDMYVFEIRQ